MCLGQGKDNQTTASPSNKGEFDPKVLAWVQISFIRYMDPFIKFQYSFTYPTLVIQIFRKCLVRCTCAVFNKRKA